MHKNTATKGSPLDAADRDRLAALVEREGERAALTRIGCNRQTLYRAVGGFPVYPGTAALIRERLALVEAPPTGTAGGCS